MRSSRRWAWRSDRVRDSCGSAGAARCSGQSGNTHGPCRSRRFFGWSSTDFAFYSIGCLTVPPLLILEISVNRVLIPALASAFAQTRTEVAARLYRQATLELAYFALPAVTGMIVFAGPIIELLFTRTYSSASSYLRVYALYYLAVIVPIDAVPRARGEAKWILWSYVFFSVLTLALCLGLTLRFGPFGALAGLLTARLANRAYAAFYVRQTTGWRLGEFIPLGETARMLTVCVVLGAVCLAARPLFSTGLGWFLMTGAGFSIAYFVLTIAWLPMTPLARLIGRIKTLMEYAFGK